MTTLKLLIDIDNQTIVEDLYNTINVTMQEYKTMHPHIHLEMSIEDVANVGTTIITDPFAKTDNTIPEILGEIRKNIGEPTTHITEEQLSKIKNDVISHFEQQFSCDSDNRNDDYDFDTEPEQNNKLRLFTLWGIPFILILTGVVGAIATGLIDL